MEQRSVTFASHLIDELYATIHVTRIDQVDADFPHGVTVKLVIALPTSGSDIDYRLSFGSKLHLLGQHLFRHWGAQDPGRTRSRSQNFTADNWRQAFQTAQAHAAMELDSLIIALRTRRLLLELTENDLAKPPIPPLTLDDIDEEEL